MYVVLIVLLVIIVVVQVHAYHVLLVNIVLEQLPMQQLELGKQPVLKVLFQTQVQLLCPIATVLYAEMVFIVMVLKLILDGIVELVIGYLLDMV